ncbi:hypothetical protein D3C87_1597130 [compost metagenome]
MSSITSWRDFWRKMASTASLSATPLPGTIFSSTEKVRWLLAITVVRSGVTKPRCTARPASMSSAAISTSTSPGTAICAITGRRPGVGSMSSM